MYATTGRDKKVSRKIRKDFSIRSEPVRNNSRNRGAAEKSCSPGSCHANDYLIEEFRTIPAVEWNQLFSEKNYRYLYECSRNYFQLLGKRMPTAYNPCNFRELYDDLAEVVSVNNELSLFDYNEELHFRINEESGHAGMLFYVPCEILDHVYGQFREILLQFFRILKFTHALTSQKDSYHFQGWVQELEYLEELRDEGNEYEAGYALEALEEDWVNELKRYRDGDIGSTLSLIDEHPKYAPRELVQLIEKYTPSGKKEAELLSLIVKGLNDFLVYEKFIFNYVGRHGIDDGSDFLPADELFMIIYRDDWACEQMIESVNITCQNGDFEYFYSGTIELTPDTDVLMEKNDFVEPFLDWVIDLSNTLYDYILKDNNNDNI